MDTWTEEGRVDFKETMQDRTLSKDPGTPRLWRPPAWRCLSPRRGGAGVARPPGARAGAEIRRLRGRAPTQLRPGETRGHAEQLEQKEGESRLKAGNRGTGLGGLTGHRGG